MGSKTRLGSDCTKRANNGVNLATSRKIHTRLARPIVVLLTSRSEQGIEEASPFLCSDIQDASRNNSVVM